MGKRCSWTDMMLAAAVAKNRSYRAVILELGLVPAGGNYVQVQERCKILKLDTSHFKGMGWNTGEDKKTTNVARSLGSMLRKGSGVQSYKLKLRLFQENIMHPECVLCGWAECSKDGRIPVELDHVNGDHSDNRLENLRILCPNCHSLQPTHRGRNKRRRLIKTQI